MLICGSFINQSAKQLKFSEGNDCRHNVWRRHYTKQYSLTDINVFFFNETSMKFGILNGMWVMYPIT